MKRNDKVVKQAYKETPYGNSSGTQYGNHVGYSAIEYQMKCDPSMDLGKPKGDNNRASKGDQLSTGYYFGVNK